MGKQKALAEFADYIYANSLDTEKLETKLAAGDVKYFRDLQVALEKFGLMNSRGHMLLQNIIEAIVQEIQKDE
jgi:virulence-associated protein VapD